MALGNLYMNLFLNLNKLSFWKLELILLITTLLIFGMFVQAQDQQQAGNAFTVQLASLDSQEDSQAVRDGLRQAGYPAYVVQDNRGYHLRVGHFLNPQAAQKYVLGLQSTQSFQDDFVKNFERGFGTKFTPTAIVADGVAQNEFALSAELLMNYPYATGLSLKVHEWADEGRALRFQGRVNAANFEASYLVLNNIWDQSAFPAWRADGEADGSLVRVFSDRLWPQDVEGLTARELAKLQEEKLEQIADSMELSAASFGLSIFNEPGLGRPYVIRPQRVDASTGFVESYPALGIPTALGVKAQGPELKWFDRGFVDEVPKTVTPIVQDVFGLLQQDSGSDALSVIEGMPLSLEGSNWQSFAFEHLTAIRVQNGDSWLPIAGTPIWAYQDYVLVVQGSEVLLYKIYLSQ